MNLNARQENLQMNNPISYLNNFPFGLSKSANSYVSGGYKAVSDLFRSLKN